MRIGVNLGGDLIAKFEKASQELQAKIAEATELTAKEMAETAKSKAAWSEQGGTSISSQINAVQIDANNWEVQSNSPISAYVDFGTGVHAARYVSQLPDDLRQYALLFYVNGLGTLGEHPFFAETFQLKRQEYIERCRKILEEL